MSARSAYEAAERQLEARTRAAHARKVNDLNRNRKARPSRRGERQS